MKNERDGYYPEATNTNVDDRKGYQPSPSRPNHVDGNNNPKPPRFQTGVNKPQK